MTKQPKALRLADEHDENGWFAGTKQWCKESSAELRRLHTSEHEGWRYADELRQERKRLHEVNQMLLDALNAIADETYDSWTNGAIAQQIAIAAIEKAGEE